MGDRGNAYVEMPTGYGPNAGRGGIYLYTHWSGWRFPETIRNALDFAKPRWTDEQYGARILVSRVFADIADDTVGGGLGLTIGDDSDGYPVVVVSFVDQTVSFAKSGEESDPDKRFGAMSFREYVDQREASYPRVPIDY